MDVATVAATNIINQYALLITFFDAKNWTKPSTDVNVEYQVHTFGKPLGLSLNMISHVLKGFLV